MNILQTILPKNYFRICILFGLLVSACSAQAQEYLTGLKRNTQIIKELHSKNEKGTAIKSITNEAQLLLPFFEDFSNDTGFPNQKLFTDKQTFVNNTFPLFPPTVGVVTLDALNEYGEIYKHLNTSPKGADTLTSRYIRLDSLFRESDTVPIRLSDSLYFSFYFQPGGAKNLGVSPGESIGNQPDIGDSLVLEFGIMDTITVWHHIWSTPGMSIDKWLAENNFQYFKQIMIPITDEKFLSNTFQFRFRNYASLEPQTGMTGWEGNVDQWHIDYIRLDVNRNIDDVFTQDLAFVSPTTSFLNNYYSMPYKQFKKTDVKSKFSNQLTNLYNSSATSEYKYIISYKGAEVANYNYSVDINPYYTHGIQFNTGEEANQTSPNILTSGFPNTLSDDTATFTVTHIFYNTSAGAGNDFCSANDTCVFVQKFYDYYAYDDGTAEYGYCINNKYDIAYLALKFPLNVPDSLRGLRMWFNHTQNDENQNALFDIIVWNDKDGKPGNIIYRMEDNQPQFSDHFLDFVEFTFDQKILVSGTIWVGFEQKGNVQLNIGFDQNTDSRAFFRHNTKGTWEESFYKGTPMIRPVFGTPVVISSVNNLPKITSIIAPNPAHKELRITNYELRIKSVEVYDMMGRKQNGEWRMENGEWKMNVAHFANGFYFVRIMFENNKVETLKFIKN